MFNGSSSSSNMVRIPLTLLCTAVAFCATVPQGHALSLPLTVPDYISEMPTLKHCNEISNNVGGFSVSRVRCGCDDDEVKVGNRLGTTRIGQSFWKITHFSAFCKPEGMEDRCMCPRGPLAPLCEPGERPQNCDCCGCSCRIPPLKPLEPKPWKRVKSLVPRRLRSCDSDRLGYLHSCTRANSYAANCYIKAAQMCPGARTCSHDRSNFLRICTRGNSIKSKCYLTASKMCPGAYTCSSDKSNYLRECKRENTLNNDRCYLVSSQMCR